MDNDVSVVAEILSPSRIWIVPENHQVEVCRPRSYPRLGDRRVAGGCWTQGAAAAGSSGGTESYRPHARAGC
jgi:hypothetical protein